MKSEIPNIDKYIVAARAHKIIQNIILHKILIYYAIKTLKKKTEYINMTYFFWT